ncbi:MAG TPA: DNA polymerase III subunit delta [Candidatus Paceibacterota bacterium]|nr:DNA polymerase III subunit delta [Candidatus Paceibacterota bacterium]
MIIFLYGTDGYRLRQNRETVLASYRAKHASGMNLFFADGASDEGLAALENALKTNSFFQEVQLIALTNVFASPDRAIHIQEILERFGVSQDPQRVVMAIHPGSAAEAKPKAVFDFLAAKPHLVREFSPLAGAKLEQWIKAEAAGRTVSFAPGALQKFLAMAGSDSWQRIQNLEKVANYARGPITSEAVSALIRTEQETNIFEFVDAVGAGKTAQALERLYAELAQGRDPYYIASMLAYQVRTMLAVKDATARAAATPAVAATAGVHPFVAKKMIPTVAVRSLAALRQDFQRLADLELAAKNGLVDLADALYAFVLR